MEALDSGRLLYGEEEKESVDRQQRVQVAVAGTALSASHGRGFINRPLSELVWIDLADEVDAIDVDQEEAMEESYEELGDHFIEFREDNTSNKDAASLRYSLPLKPQSEVLQQQIADFRAYRRQRFSLFRRGPLVEETTISGNIKSLLRFLGYLHYEQSGELQQLAVVALDMSVFALPNISSLVLSYVEWLEQRRGRKPRAADDEHTFQPVSCTTLSSYLNGLVSIVKFQLRQDVHRRDLLLDQLRNLRSQAESYSMTQKGFEKVHPQWCSWRELQVAREKCRAAFDQRDDEEEESGRAYLLHLRELCLLCLLTICPPPRVSIVRLLEWDKTLVQGDKGHWMVDLTDLSYAATRHKTHKRKGALQLPLPMLLFPYLAKLQRLSHRAHGGAVFPGRASSSSLTPTSFTTFVKTTFGKYTDSGRSPNPSLLRSIFTTWLYGIRYDTEDAFLQQIKASSARWKAHSEQIAATVYNRELIYQQQEFAVLLRFCELYSSRFSYDGGVNGIGSDVIPADENEGNTESKATRSGRKRRSVALPLGVAQAVRELKRRASVSTYVVEELVDVRVTKQGIQQVQVRWEGYLRCTWEPYESIREQLPDMLATLEEALASDSEDEDNANELQSFLDGYITAHHIDALYRWTPDRLVALEHASDTHHPPIKLTVDRLQKSIVQFVNLCGNAKPASA